MGKIRASAVTAVLLFSLLSGLAEAQSLRGLEPQPAAAVRHLLDEMPRLPRHRQTHDHAVWVREDEGSSRIWEVTPAQQCLERLRDLGVRHMPLVNADGEEDLRLRGRLRDAVGSGATALRGFDLPLSRLEARFLVRNWRHIEAHVPTPVVLGTELAGVTLETMHDDRAHVFACDFVLRLHEAFTMLREHEGIDAIGFMSTVRTRPWESFHTRGMGADLAWFRERGGRNIVVNHNFHETPNLETCDRRAFAAVRADSDAGRLLSIACVAFESGLFQTVLTANYNSGHRDHIHVDARPYDNRRFLR